MSRRSEKLMVDLVEAFTELGPAWGHWVGSCLPEDAVSYVRLRLLTALKHGNGQTMASLAKALNVTPRRVTDLVDALEADGLVERNPNPRDGRSTLISITSGRSKAPRDRLAAASGRRRRCFRRALAQPTEGAAHNLTTTDRDLPSASGRAADDRRLIVVASRLAVCALIVTTRLSGASSPIGAALLNVARPSLGVPRNRLWGATSQTFGFLIQRSRVHPRLWLPHRPRYMPPVPPPASQVRSARLTTATPPP